MKTNQTVVRTEHNPIPTYPELDEIAAKIALDACRQICFMAEHVESKMPYKQQYILEVVIQELSKRV